MKSNYEENELRFTNLLPFMNEKYLNKFLTSAGFKPSKIEMIHYMDLPDAALVTFENPEIKHKFMSKFHGQNYPKINYRIKIEDPYKGKSKGIQRTHSVLKSPQQHRINTIKSDQIHFKIPYQNLIKTSYKMKLDTPGLIYIDEDVLSKQEQIIGYLFKKMGSNLLSGKSIMNISLPVNIFDPRTLLQVYAYELSFAPIFLTRAFYATDQIEKIKWISVFLISQLHLSPLQTKPFNPIIGETFQCTIGNLDVYLEQTVNKPPTSNFYAYSNDGMFKIYGYICTSASTSINSALAEKSGIYVVQFSDGRSYSLRFPGISIKGITYGSRIFNFVETALVEDRKFDLAVHLKFNPDERNSLVRFFGGKQKTYPDKFRGKIIPFSDLFSEDNKIKPFENAKTFCNIEGEWTESMRCDDESYWHVNDYELIPLRKMKFILPSDSTFREDLKSFINNEDILAQDFKEKYEQTQRDDRKLREKYLKKKQ